MDETLDLRASNPVNGLDLGSDHRAVLASFLLKGQTYNRKKSSRKISAKKVDWAVYQDKIQTRLKAPSFTNNASIENLEDTMVTVALEARNIFHSHSSQPSLELRKLRRARRFCQSFEERTNLSKQIFKLSRQELRNRKDTSIRQTLEEFKDLGRLGEATRQPIRRTAKEAPDFDKCADILKEVYRSSSSNLPLEGSSVREPIPACTLQEIQKIVSQMSKRKCADRAGIIAEMFLYGGDCLLEYLVEFFNGIINTGEVPANWKESFFILLHKGGPTADPNNWRPIAILRIVYKIFARMIYGRIKETLNLRQSDEQYGFRADRSTNDALIIAESMVGKCLEYNTELWIVSVDLKKAFDRVEHKALFESLRNHGLGENYCQLLREIYDGQLGVLSDQICFNITRGVRQGDILSPILFNCALDNAVSNWKSELFNEGFALDDSTERLTNIRFADDLLLFGKTMNEAIHMAETLVEKLAGYGLELNIKKTKIMSTTVTTNEPTLIDTQVGFMELVPAGCTHKYLGRSWPGDFRKRGEVAVNHRISCAWMKFKEFESTLVNKSVSLRLRLKLFAAIVSPTVLYSLGTCPLTEKLLQKLDVTQRRMIRKMIGWVSIQDDDSWEDVGHNMKIRMNAALALFPVPAWSDSVGEIKASIKRKLSSCKVSQLVAKACLWDPPSCNIRNKQDAHRNAGRPRVRWDDKMEESAL